MKTISYRQPRQKLERLWRWGAKAYFFIDHWKQQMERFAWDELPPSLPVNDATPAREIFFMTGRDHWYQTAFCMSTFMAHSRQTARATIIDDGTLTEPQCKRLSELFQTVILSRSECDALVQQSLPENKFPNIHRWRKRQVLFRKLIDLHHNSREHRVFFDSDMLFFSRPTEIDNYLQAPHGAIFQTDCWESYGYTRQLTESLCGRTLPESINIGIFSLDGKLIDWEKVEYWVGQMEQKEAARYNITQCTCAMLISGMPQVRLPYERYPVLPTNRDQLPNACLKHYVSDAKPLYFQYGWRRALETSRISEKPL